MNNDVKYVGIRKDLFDEIDEYAKLNGIKTTRLINNLLRDRFMTEKYGESPFDAFAKKVEIVETPPEIQKVVNENFWEMLGDDKPKETEPRVMTRDESEKKLVELLSTHTIEENGSVTKELVDKLLNEVDEIMAVPATAFVKQTPESQAIIDEHNKLLEEKNNKPKKRRLK